MTLPPFAHGEPARYYALPGVIATSFRDKTLVLLVEIRGQQLVLMKKFSAGATRVEPAQISGKYFGLWLAGGPHVVMWSTPTLNHSVPTRLAGNVLLWEVGNRTYRIEGKLSKADAVDLAGKITP
jgi:hypothetical protein